MYEGNVPDEGGENTYCYQCGELLIRCYGFQILENKIRDSRCPSCGARIDGIFISYLYMDLQFIYMVKCPKCGREIKGYEEGWECCPYCGACLFVDCPFCDQRLEQEWSYCPYCGHPVPKEKT